MAAAAPPPPVLMDELIEEVLLRLPPGDPACLVRSSAVCKPWRRMFALPRFRRRYHEFHGTPPLLGYIHQSGAKFVPTSALIPAQPDRPGWAALDCRHGRALFAPSFTESWKPFDFIIVEVVTGHQSRVPSPVPEGTMFSASVLCAAQGCDHHGCQGEHFLLALVSTDWHTRVTSGWVYSSETCLWSKLTALHHPNVNCASHMDARSVLVGDALYFGIMDAIVKCQLGTPLSFSMFETPIDGDGRLMTAEDGGLGFAAVVDIRNLTLWSMETGPEGAMGWAIIRVIDLEVLLPNGLSNPELEYGIPPRAIVSGAAEGTQVIFVTTDVGCYLVDLKSGRVTMVCREEIILPYMGFYIPAMKATSTD